MTDLGMKFQTKVIRNFRDCSNSIEAIVVAAGFEERAFEVLSKLRLPENGHCILIKFKNELPENQEVHRKFVEEIAAKYNSENVHIVELDTDRVIDFEARFESALTALPREIRTLGIDVSGMPTYAICVVLRLAREHRAHERLAVFYTSALSYTPTFEEYEDLLQKQGEQIEYVPQSMALEMSENLVLDAFSGYRSREGRSCLAIFAGYELHRSAGVLESINPSLLLLMYGNPGNTDLSWRLDLSRNLHLKFESERRSATETVSTLDVESPLSVLESYYTYLIDDYDLTIAPICSKMQTVASYLFWERHGEIQLIFPLPIGYDPGRRPKGIGKSYMLTVDAKASLFRGF